MFDPRYIDLKTVSDPDRIGYRTKQAFAYAIVALQQVPENRRAFSDLDDITEIFTAMIPSEDERVAYLDDAILQFLEG